MRIYLVRHGQSEANEDWSQNTHRGDYSIPLNQEGQRQAAVCADFLVSEFARRPMAHVRLWHSPYIRASMTADPIEEAFQRARIVYSRREHLLLHEQNHGLFDGLSNEEIRAQYPQFWATYAKNRLAEGGRIWASYPMGESVARVCERVHQSFGTFHRDAERRGIRDIVVVAHGIVNRAFTAMWLHLPSTWIEEEPNPNNCSVRLIHDGVDKGYVFEGFPSPDGHAKKKSKSCTPT